MKLSRTAAAAIGVAVVAVSGLAIAAPASAATPDVTYIHFADLSNGVTPGSADFGYNIPAPTDSLSGLQFPSDGVLVKDFGPGVITDDFGDFLAGVTVGTTSTTPNEFTFLGYYTDATAGSYGELISVGGGYTTQWDPAVGLWQATSNFGTFAAFSSHTLDEYLAQAAVAYPALTVGLIGLLNPLAATSYSDLYVNGTQYIFTPTPVFTAPTTLTSEAFGTTGITVTTSGFLPNETGIDVGLGSGATGGSVGTVSADAQGVATFTYVEPSPQAGSYRLSFFGSVPNPQQFDFTVTAAALPQTGADAEVPLIAGGVLLLGGVALAIVAARRRRTA